MLQIQIERECYKLNWSHGSNLVVGSDGHHDLLVIFPGNDWSSLLPDTASVLPARALLAEFLLGGGFGYIFIVACVQ